MDEEYVQEHILLTVLSRQLEAPRRLIHGRLQQFRSAFSRHTPTHLFWSGCCVLVLRVAVARSNATRSMLTSE